MPSRVQRLEAELASTPTSSTIVEYRGRAHEVLLKHECVNPTGSIKDRTAVGLLKAMDRIEPIVPGTVVVESTSGNLGLGLARLLAELDSRLIAVIDPKTAPGTRELLTAAGVELCFVDEPDGMGGYLLSRLRKVQELCRANPEYRWPDQYANVANPWIHRVTTGPEIARQGGAELDAVYVAVSTGGTLAGISAHLRTIDRPIRIVAVDGQASLVTSSPPGRRLIPGIGASRPSTFLDPSCYDHATWVPDVEAIAVCRMLLVDTGTGIGGSAGCVLRACLRDLGGANPPRRPLCLCPDSDEKYRTSLFDDGWLELVDLRVEVEQAVSRLRAEGLRFRKG